VAKDQIVIVTRIDDPHADDGILALERQGYEAIRLNNRRRAGQRPDLDELRRRPAARRRDRDPDQRAADRRGPDPLGLVATTC